MPLKAALGSLAICWQQRLPLLSSSTICRRKGKLEAAVKAKERILQERKGKPDPMQRAAGLQRDIARLNTQVETAVRLRALQI